MARLLQSSGYNAICFARAVSAARHGGGERAPSRAGAIARTRRGTRANPFCARARARGCVCGEATKP